MTSWSVEEELSVELEGIEEVSIRLIGGEVSVTAGDGPARLEISDVEESPVEVRQKGSLLEIWHRESHGSGRRGFFGILSLGRSPKATVTLTVPASTRVSVATVSADTVLAGLQEPAELKTVSGDVTLKDCGERLEVKTVSGDVEAHGVGGDLRFGSVSGDLSVVNGACAWLAVKTVSGDVVLDLDMQPNGVYSFQSVSGDVAIRVPEQPSVTIEMQTLSGSLDTPWDMGFDDARPGRRRARHVVGDGAARLTMKSVSGDLRIVPRTAAGAA